MVPKLSDRQSYYGVSYGVSTRPFIRSPLKPAWIKRALNGYTTNVQRSTIEHNTITFVLAPAGSHTLNRIPVANPKGKTI